MDFFVGLHQPSDARHFGRCMVSANRLRRRRGDFAVGDWLLDSGAFTQIFQHGEFRDSPEDYARQVRRWARCGRLLAAVSQDYMCEPFILSKWGQTVRGHQQKTIERYDTLRQAVPFDVYLMPVLQGYWPSEYVQHLHDYGSRLREGMWVGVGSVCKRNSSAGDVEQVLRSVQKERPDHPPAPGAVLRLLRQARHPGSLRARQRLRPSRGQGLPRPLPPARADQRLARVAGEAGHTGPPVCGGRGAVPPRRCED